MAVILTLRSVVQAETTIRPFVGVKIEICTRKRRRCRQTLAPNLFVVWANREVDDRGFTRWNGYECEQRTTATGDATGLFAGEVCRWSRGHSSSNAPYPEIQAVPAQKFWPYPEIRAVYPRKFQAVPGNSCRTLYFFAVPNGGYRSDPVRSHSERRRQPWKCESGPGPGARPVRIRPASGNLTGAACLRLLGLSSRPFEPGRGEHLSVLLVHKLPDDVCGFNREKNRGHGSANQYQGQSRGLSRFGRPAECQSNGAVRSGVFSGRPARDSWIPAD
ncbi:hypothetical protein Bbelb_151650 [Branchiostoma belcheri]|nr:hypothetical protein Bbelb_151650 [Branchiostoma belcheri]